MNHSHTGLLSVSRRLDDELINRLSVTWFSASLLCPERIAISSPPLAPPSLEAFIAAGIEVVAVGSPGSWAEDQQG